VIPVTIPRDMRSDGCTFPGPLQIFKGIMGASRYIQYCREHDFLRRYEIINWFKANLLLGRRIAGDGWEGKLRAPFYFLFTTVSYPLYSNTKRLPPEWKKYANIYRSL